MKTLSNSELQLWTLTLQVWVDSNWRGPHTESRPHGESSQTFLIWDLSVCSCLGAPENRHPKRALWSHCLQVQVGGLFFRRFVGWKQDETRQVIRGATENSIDIGIRICRPTRTNPLGCVGVEKESWACLIVRGCKQLEVACISFSHTKKREDNESVMFDGRAMSFWVLGELGWKYCQVLGCYFESCWMIRWSTHFLGDMKTEILCRNSRYPNASRAWSTSDLWLGRFWGAKALECCLYATNGKQSNVNFLNIN